MKTRATELQGCYVIELEPKRDERGFFARSFCKEELANTGIHMDIVQANWSHNVNRGTVRGMHFQREPYGEPKIVCCVRGSMFDVFVDLRPDSATYLRSVSVELDAQQLNAVYLPEGIAHGFQTLTDDVLVQYWMGAPYMANAASGIRHDDPSVEIRWPLPVRALSERDRTWPLLERPT